jgi:hypothetical protein
LKLRLFIDGLSHDIDSTDPELLSKWIVEIFGRIRQITPATRIEVQAFPSFVPDEPGDLRHGQGGWHPDWTADSRVIGQIVPVRSPRELLAALGKQLDEAEALSG